MGFKNNRIIKKEDFKPLELNEGNVQAIFNRCLAKSDSKDVVSTSIASSITGFSQSAVKSISFDKPSLLLNQQNIEYLYGQLKSAHITRKRIPVSDFLCLI